MTNPVPPITERAALLLVAAILCALVMGVLAFLAFGNVPMAVIAGLTAFGGSFAFLHAHIRSDDERDRPDHHRPDRGRVPREQDRNP